MDNIPLAFQKGPVGGKRNQGRKKVTKSRKRKAKSEVPDKKKSKEDSTDLDDMPLLNRGEVAEEETPKRRRTRKTRSAPSPSPPPIQSPPPTKSPPRRKGRSSTKPATPPKPRKRRR